jgi:cytochrome P450
VPWRLGDYAVEADTPVTMSILLLHHREDVYPDPYAFRPERFIEQPAGTYTWIPFGGGVRRCLGAAFAEFEMAVVLRELVASRRIQPVGDQPEHSVRSTITNVPNRGAEVLVTPR